MKFAALALMAVVLFSDYAEAKRGSRGGKGKGKKPADAICELAEDAVPTGQIELFQGTNKRTGEVKPIWTKIELDLAEAPVEPTLQIYDRADCAGTEILPVDEPMGLNVKECLKKDADEAALMRLFGKLPDNTVLVDDLLATAHSVQITSETDRPICCNLVEPAEPDEALTGRKLSEDVLQF